MEHRQPFEIDTTADRVYRRFYNQGIAEDVKEWANAQLRAIQGDLDYVLDHDDGYQEFLLEYIQQEAEKDEDDREASVCTCDDFGCKLKRGQLPHVIRDADDMAVGIKEFEQIHDGTPIVLQEGSAEWSEKRAYCWYVLRELEAHMIAERDEAPDTDPAEDDPPAPGVAAD